MTKMKLAERIFEAQINDAVYKDEFENEALRILQIKGDWPFADYSFDYYDGSFELRGCDPALKLSEEQQKEFWQLGFSQCWLNYEDDNGIETERFYCPSYPQGALKRKSDGVYLEKLI